MRESGRVALRLVFVGLIVAGIFVAGRMSAGGNGQPPLAPATDRLAALEEQFQVRMDRMEQLIASVALAQAQRKSSEARTGDSSSVVAEGTPTTKHEDEAPRPTPQPTAENQAAFEAAQQLVTESIARRVWGEQERDQLLSQLGRTTGPQHLKVIDQLILAINSGQLRPTAVPPF